MISFSNLANNGYLKLLWLIVHSKKIIVLVILYSIGNVLSYYALARVEAAVYTVTNQVSEDEDSIRNTPFTFYILPLLLLLFSFLKKILFYSTIIIIDLYF